MGEQRGREQTHVREGLSRTVGVGCPAVSAVTRASYGSRSLALDEAQCRMAKEETPHPTRGLSMGEGQGAGLGCVVNRREVRRRSRSCLLPC